MAIERQLIKSRDGMVLKGVSIVAFGLVALCYPGEEVYTMMTAFGILVTINGPCGSTASGSLKVAVSGRSHY